MEGCGHVVLAGSVVEVGALERHWMKMEDLLCDVLLGSFSLSCCIISAQHGH